MQLSNHDLGNWLPPGASEQEIEQYKKERAEKEKAAKERTHARGRCVDRARARVV